MHTHNKIKNRNDYVLCNSYGLQNVYECYKIHQEQLIPTHWDQGLFEYLLVEEQIISHKGI